ncbi:hypothetical protein ACQKG7_20630 [Lysinibacillus fusiformis]|uniref:hypothetical protein n=1 Tax=Lysinibacillus fusiformis TaxID=28031 RepID=UPI0037C6042F
MELLIENIRYIAQGTKYNEMERFLMELREGVPIASKDDIDFVLEEMCESFNYASNY